MDYDVKKDSWFSPIEIINRFEQLRAVYGNNINESLFKRAREMFGAAVTLLGSYGLSTENKYFMQSNNQSDSPDVMAAKQTEKEGIPILLEMSQLEVTELEEHFKSDDVVEFLREVKLKKIDNEYMMIVCFVNRIMPIDHHEIHTRLRELSPKSTIYIVGKPIDASPGTFLIFTPYPQLTKPLQFNIDVTAGKFTIPPRVRFHLGTEHKIIYNKAEMELLNVYEILGLDQTKIMKKYQKIR